MEKDGKEKDIIKMVIYNSLLIMKVTQNIILILLIIIWNLKENMKMEKGMEEEKNIVLIVN